MGRNALQYANSPTPRSGRAASIVCIVLTMLGAGYLALYYGLARSRPTRDGFCVEYPTDRFASGKLETLHRPLIWLDEKRYVRVHPLPGHPSLDSRDLQSVHFDLAKSHPAVEMGSAMRATEHGS